MATHKGVERMKLRLTRIVHEGGHCAYNAYVGKVIAHILQTYSNQAVIVMAVALFQKELKRRIRTDDPTLPWM